MMLESIKNIYFLGIGGIGMSALAHWTNLKKFNTQGWDDDTDTPTLLSLINSGLTIHNSETKSQFFLDSDKLHNNNTIIIINSSSNFLITKTAIKTSDNKNSST